MLCGGDDFFNEEKKTWFQALALYFCGLLRITIRST
jgi:hypothetical protein